jgi:dTMP kinase
MTTQRGRFIAIEGMDAAGKSTHSKLLAAAINAERITAPSDSSIGKLIRSVLGGEVPWPGGDALQLLFLADRAAMAEQIKALLAAGRNVVSDRWSLSGLVYGGVDVLEKHNNDTKELIHWNQWYEAADKHSLQPEFYVVLDVDPKVAWERVTARGGKTERYENVERMKSVSRRYENINWYQGRYVHHLHSYGSKEDVSEALIGFVQGRLEQVL